MSYLRLRQVCLVAPELDTPVRALREILDLHVCHRDPRLARYGLENVIFPVATHFIEIVAPIESDTAAGRFLERSHGRGGYMAIFDCDNPDTRAAHAESLGIPVVNRPQADIYTGCQLHPRHCRAAMIEFNHTDGGQELDGPYWPAGPDWQASRASSITKRLDGIDLASPEPENLALHWSRILEGNPQPDRDGYRLAMNGTDLRWCFSDGQRENLAALRLTVDDPAEALARATRHGCPTGPDHFDLAGVSWRLNSGS